MFDMRRKQCHCKEVDINEVPPMLYTEDNVQVLLESIGDGSIAAIDCIEAAIRQLPLRDILLQIARRLLEPANESDERTTLLGEDLLRLAVGID